MDPTPNIIRFVCNELESFSRNNKKIDFFYHYTTLEAFESILKSNEIRFSDCKYLNDSSEVEHGLKKVRHLINGKLIECKQSKIKNHPHEKKLIKLSEGMSSLSPDFPKYYVFCLCEGSDLLSQWRGYSKNSLPIMVPVF